MYEKKYKKDELITSLDDLIQEKFIYCGNQILHHGWFASWTLRFTMQQIKAKRIFRAKRIESEGK